MSTLVLIPARAGSKGIPGKNKKMLGAFPLIHYSLVAALKRFSPTDICVSTDDPEIIQYAKDLGIAIPFIRPGTLATDTSTSYDVMLHAVKHYEERGKVYDHLLFLQPTSPFRTQTDFSGVSQLMDEQTEMVVSVMQSDANPYYNLFEEDKNGYLSLSKQSSFTRRQDCPQVYQYNGSFYLIRIKTLKKKPLNQFTRIKKYVMSNYASVDLDTPTDWLWAEFLMQHNFVQYEQ